MKIIFQHTYGRITKSDWQYSPIYAVFDKSEFEKAANTGWIPHEYDPPLWFQARQVRYRLNEYLQRTKHKIPSRIDFNIKTDLKNIEAYEEIWKVYLNKKGFDEDQSLDRLFSLDPEKKIVVEVYDYDELVAFSVIRMEPIPVSLQFAWTYHNPKLSLGIHCQYFELDYLAKSGEFTHSYVCPGYETACIWKSRFPGFEFWDGTEWSSDKNLYERLCMADSNIVDPDDLSDDILIPLKYDFSKLADW